VVIVAILIIAIFSVQTTSYIFSLKSLGNISCIDCGGSWDACRYDLFIPLWPFIQFIITDSFNSQTFICPLGEIHNINFAYNYIPLFTFDYLIALIPHLIYWYLLSCLIIRVYDKFRGRKK
jgi:hypothetical protein